MHILIPYLPPVPLRLVRGQFVEDKVDLLALILLYHAAHEVEEFQMPEALLMPARNLGGAHVQRGEPGGGAVPLIIMRRADHRSPVG